MIVEENNAGNYACPMSLTRGVHTHCKGDTCMAWVPETMEVGTTPGTFGIPIPVMGPTGKGSCGMVRN
jgi:hypothetical protein